MNSMLATETTGDAGGDAPVVSTPAPAAALPLEIHAQNEQMRHIPVSDWMIRKLDGDVRRRTELLLDVLRTLPGDDPRHADLEGPLRSLCRCIDRLADAVRHGRNNHAPNEIAAHLRWSLEHAVANLRTLDMETFGRRAPFHHFDRSRAEAVYGALLCVFASLDRAVEVARAIDPLLDERLYAHLVQLETPMRREPMA
jgi:hypothetical protein